MHEYMRHVCMYAYAMNVCGKCDNVQHQHTLIAASVYNCAAAWKEVRTRSVKLKCLNYDTKCVNLSVCVCLWVYVL